MGESHIDLCTQCVIKTQITWPRQPLLMHASFASFFDKIYSFLKKMSQISSTAKRVDYIFEEPLNLHIIVGSLFFLFRSVFREKIELSWRNYLNWPAEKGPAGRIISQIHRIYLHVLSAIAIMQVIFWTEDNSVLFLIAGIHSIANSKRM